MDSDVIQVQKEKVAILMPLHFHSSLLLGKESQPLYKPQAENMQRQITHR